MTEVTNTIFGLLIPILGLCAIKLDSQETLKAFCIFILIGLVFTALGAVLSPLHPLHAPTGTVPIPYVLYHEKKKSEQRNNLCLAPRLLRSSEQKFCPEIPERSNRSGAEHPVAPLLFLLWSMQDDRTNLIKFLRNLDMF